MRLFHICLLALFLPMPVLYGQTSVRDSVPEYLSLRVLEYPGGSMVIGYNSNPGPMTMYCRLRDNDSTIMERIIQPGDSMILIRSVKPARAIRDSISQTLKFGYFLGDALTVTPDPDHVYLLPFAPGKKFKVSQGFNSKYSHNGPYSAYAVDFNLKTRDPVYAARAGLVVTAVGWFSENGGIEFRPYANRIVILHDDGTLASYVHLDYRGVLVKDGDRVERGQHIGYAGNTGYSRGPHLHFVVRGARDITIPVRFEGYGDRPMESGMKVMRK